MAEKTYTEQHKHQVQRKKLNELLDILPDFSYTVF